MLTVKTLFKASISVLTTLGMVLKLKIKFKKKVIRKGCDKPKTSNSILQKIDYQLVVKLKSEN